MRKKYILYGSAAIIIAACVGALTSGILLLRMLGDEPQRVVYAQKISTEDEEFGQKVNNLFVKVIDKALLSVVQIDAFSPNKKAAPQSIWEFFFNENPGSPPSDGDPGEYRDTLLGSGFVVEREGDKLYLITNNHVIMNADPTMITVEFKNGRRFAAKLLGQDKNRDLAMLEIKVEADDDNLLPIEFGDSDKLQVGEWVLAIGSPLSLGFSVTSGIISFLNRGSPQAGVLKGEFIQTDASINQGNSGGALINLRGEVIGVNTWIVPGGRGGGGSIGLGFALPSNTVKRVLSVLKSGKDPSYGFLGVNILGIKEIVEMMRYQVAATSVEYVKSAGWPKQIKGTIVGDVYSSTPAHRAGILPGDLITEINGQQINNRVHFVSIISSLELNKNADMKIIRNGQNINIQVKIESRIEDLKSEAWPGILIYPVIEELRKKYNIKGGLEGVFISMILPGSLLSTAGLRYGDFITSINGEKVNSVLSFYAVLNKVSSKSGKLNIEFIREGRPLNIGVTR